MPPRGRKESPRLLGGCLGGRELYSSSASGGFPQALTQPRVSVRDKKPQHSDLSIKEAAALGLPTRRAQPHKHRHSTQPKMHLQTPTVAHTASSRQDTHVPTRESPRWCGRLGSFLTCQPLLCVPLSLSLVSLGLCLVHFQRLLSRLLFDGDIPSISVYGSLSHSCWSQLSVTSVFASHTVPHGHPTHESLLFSWLPCSDLSPPSPLFHSSLLAAFFLPQLPVPLCDLFLLPSSLFPFTLQGTSHLPLSVFKTPEIIAVHTFWVGAQAKPGVAMTLVISGPIGGLRFPHPRTEDKRRWGGGEP